MKNDLIYWPLKVMLRLYRFKNITISTFDKNEYVDKIIEKTISQNGFVPLNRNGEYYLREFTLLQINRETYYNESKNKHEKYIESISLKHDIDSVVSKQSKELVVSGRLTGLQSMINYFNHI